MGGILSGGMGGILSGGDFVLGGILSRGILSGGFCPRTIFRLHLLYMVFKLCALKVKGLENFQAFAFCLKL